MSLSHEITSEAPQSQQAVKLAMIDVLESVPYEASETGATEQPLAFRLHKIGVNTLYIAENTDDITPTDTEAPIVSGEAKRKQLLPKAVRRTLALAGVFVASLGVYEMTNPDTADAQLAKIGNHDVPLPDPSVVQSPFNPNVLIAEGTSDYGQKNFLTNGTFGSSPAAIPILESKDGGLQWKFESYVFPDGQHPTQAEAPLGNWPGPRYWAPELHYIDNRWITYFATGINPGTANWIKQHYHTSAQAGEMAIFAAWTNKNDLLNGHWQSKLLRFRGQFNNIPGNTEENIGALIDPTVAEDMKTGQFMLGYTDQPNQTFIEQLSPDGLHVSKHVRRISYANLPWEFGTEEGGVLSWDVQAGVMIDELNTASTWGSGGHGYATKFIASADPLHGRWIEYKEPILRSGNGLYNPGLGSKPITLPDGKTYIFYHVLRRPRDHASQDRILARSLYNFDSKNKLYLPDGVGFPQANAQNKKIYYYDKETKNFISAPQYMQHAQSAAYQIKPQRQYIQISIPGIGKNGTP